MTETVPQMYDHCTRVYAAMSKEAKEEIVEIDLEVEGKQLSMADLQVPPTRLVYEGHLTKIFNQLELATPYYTSVLTHLKKMGCVQQLRRGGGSQTSRWELIKEPDVSDFDTDNDGDRPTTLKARVTFLEKELAKTNHNLGIVMKHLGVKL